MVVIYLKNPVHQWSFSGIVKFLIFSADLSLNPDRLMAFLYETPVNSL